MHNLPDRSLSVTKKNLSLFFLIYELKFPFSSTSVYLFIIFSLGILTLENVNAALSTPFYPSFAPMSVI